MFAMSTFVYEKFQNIFVEEIFEKNFTWKSVIHIDENSLSWLLTN